jgi:hypothetical protein
MKLHQLRKGEKKMRIFWRVLAVVVLLAAIAGIGVYAYNLGAAQGLAQKVPAQMGETVPMPYLVYGHPFFGFGFGLIGCLVPLFLLFLAFGSLRALFWHAPIGWSRMYHRRHWDWRDDKNRDVPPFFAEWHRRAHADPEEPKKE